MAIWIVSIILVVALILLVTEKLPVDLTALGIIAALMVSGILRPVEAVAGFANPAVITVGSMFVISRALIRTGAVGFIAEKVIGLSKGSAKGAIVMVLLMVAVASAFINNTPVVVLFIPVVMSLSCEFDISPSKLLIPVSYASILAGTCTLIGTSTNIIVSDLSQHYGYGKLAMFELSTLGVPIAILGIVFLVWAGPRMLQGLTGPVCEMRDSEHRRYLAEFAIPRGSKLIGMDPTNVFATNYSGMEVVEVIRYSHIFYPGRDVVKLAAGDMLLVKGSANDLMGVLNDKLVSLPAAFATEGKAIANQKSLVVELIVPPQSSLLGYRIRETRIARDPEIHVVAIQRSSLHYTEQKIHDVNLKIGDIILIRCSIDKLERLRGGGDFIIVEDVHHGIIHKRKARLAMIIFTGVVVVASIGVVDIMVCAVCGAFLMLVGGCLQLRDGYRALQADVLILIAGTIALGHAMAQTGASQFYAERFLSLFHGLSPRLILGAFIMLTSISTQLLSNNATAVLLLPIAISTALQLGVDAKPFIMAVCFGASACYATPIGYQTNLLVYGPGGYRFSDYVKLGMPLNLLVVVLGTIFIPLIWPL